MRIQITLKNGHITTFNCLRVDYQPQVNGQQLIIYQKINTIVYRLNNIKTIHFLSEESN